MLYHLDFQVEYPARMSQQQLFSIWLSEAEAALAAKKAGVVVDLWKCVGTRRVIAIVKVDDLDSLDRILLDLPIMKQMGQTRAFPCVFRRRGVARQHVQVEVTPLRRYEDFAADIKERLDKEEIAF